MNSSDESSQEAPWLVKLSSAVEVDAPLLIVTDTSEVPANYFGPIIFRRARLAPEAISPASAPVTVAAGSAQLEAGLLHEPADMVTAGPQMAMTGPLLRVDFALGNDLSSFALCGFSDQEPIGVWAIAKQSSLTIASPVHAPVELTVALFPNVSPTGPSHQRFAVLVNGQRLLETSLTEPGSIRLRLPDALTISGSPLELTFEHPDGVSPAASGVSGDVRELSVLLEVLELHQAGPAIVSPRREEHPLYVCAIFKNEAKYLYEWLSYHDAIGVDKFVLYNNNSDDFYLDVLNSWPFRSKVTVIDWPEISGQLSAYRHMLATHRNVSAWCAFIDIDEFLCPQSSLSIKQVLASMPDDCSALYVHWLMFGSSGKRTQEQGLIVERFTRRANADFEPNRIGKTIVRLDQATDAGFCHIIQSNARMINDSGDEIDQNGSGIHYRASHNVIALNHYFTKSLEEWIGRRSLGKADIQPGTPGYYRNVEEFYRHDQNVVEDTRAWKLFSSTASDYYSVRLR